MKISIIIPIFNEEENIPPLLNEIVTVMSLIPFPWEIIAIDDGSTDRSYQILREAKAQYPQLKIVKFKRNSGQTAALWAGIRHAQGHLIVTMDGDRQNDPNDIPRMLELSEKFDLVAGWRQNRKDTDWRKIQSRFANWLRRAVIQDGIIDTGCSLKVFKKPTLEILPHFSGMHRFIPAILQQNGYTWSQIPVNHRPRLTGKSKYGLRNRVLNALIDLFAVRWMSHRHLKWDEEIFHD